MVRLPCWPPAPHMPVHLCAEGWKGTKQRRQVAETLSLISPDEPRMIMATCDSSAHPREAQVIRHFTALGSRAPQALGRLRESRKSRQSLQRIAVVGAQVRWQRRSIFNHTLTCKPSTTSLTSYRVETQWFLLEPTIDAKRSNVCPLSWVTARLW